MKPKHFAILLLCAVLWTVGIAAFVYTTYKLEQVIPYRATFGISDKQVGLSAETDQLNLGMAPLGGSAKRHVYIENTQDSPRRYTMVVEGDLATYVQFTPQTFTLSPHESKMVDIVAMAPKDAPVGKYEGTISVLIEKP